ISKLDPPKQRVRKALQRFLTHDRGRVHAIVSRRHAVRPAGEVTYGVFCVGNISIKSYYRLSVEPAFYIRSHLPLIGCCVISCYVARRDAANTQAGGFRRQLRRHSFLNSKDENPLANGGIEPTIELAR